MKISKSRTQIQTKLMEFKIKDAAPKTKYKMIAESIGKVTTYNSIVIIHGRSGLKLKNQPGIILLFLPNMIIR